MEFKSLETSNRRSGRYACSVSSLAVRRGDGVERGTPTVSQRSNRRKSMCWTTARA